ncbi:hypothetical protein HPB48_006228 [Haemaphysalis longicornis]|uniref:thioredoxin-dependent peroxiredoxin n=1 Tax=Haemaphysalis longicornis TaxID=44386 RepID=A0A9J6FVF2_HAELO|nr:hypothetical protein HPB48_006228 [Haemaphysalis longicornis]
MGSACYRASEAYVLGALPRSKLTGAPTAITATERVSLAQDVREQALRQTAAAPAAAADRGDEVEATLGLGPRPRRPRRLELPPTKNMSNFADPTSVIPIAIPDVMDMVVPQLTTPAPDFCGTAVVDGQFKEIKLSDYKNKYLVLFFYTLDFTFVCPTEIIAFSDRVEEFRRVNCEVVACSTDSHFCHLACALFIIDKQARFRQVTINDLGVGRSVDEALRLVQAFQYVDEHGEVCPANWKPGSDTIRPDPNGSRAYFSKH